MSPQELRQQIRTSGLIKPDDNVELVLESGKRIVMLVTFVDDKIVQSDNESIEIDQIIAIEKSELSVGQMALFAGDTYVVYSILAALAAGFVIGL